MTSDPLPLAIRSEPDVHVAIFDGAGVEQLPERRDAERTVVLAARGLYRVRLERCGFVREEIVVHDSESERDADGPQVESPAPIQIARDPEHHGPAAEMLSAQGQESHAPLGDGPYDARLFVFVRRMTAGPRDASFPSEPVSIHDLAGRRLAAVTPDGIAGDPLQSGYCVLSCRIAPGTYRVRVGRTRRDLAITIPAQRAAHVFLADHGTISLRTARVYLPRVKDAFDLEGQVPRAMESVLWALSLPDRGLPEIAHRQLADIERDPSFGIACAHVARRQQDSASFDRIMQALNDCAPDLPDVAILRSAGLDRTTPSSLVLSSPPLYRASCVLALEAGLEIAAHSALAEATQAAHGDSMLCTWSPRWWDARWVEPIVDSLRSHRADASPTIDAMARTLRLPVGVVRHAMDRLAESAPGVSGSPSIEPLDVPGYKLDETIARGDRSTVYRAHRESDGAEVAIKLTRGHRDATGPAVERLARELAQLTHPRFVRFGGCELLPDRSALRIELELCRESLFDRVAARGRPLPYDEACDLVLQALEALAALHDRGRAHGNVDPGSLLVRNDGSVALGLPDPDASATRPPDTSRARFAAPESFADGAAATPASDVWSMAATLYFLITLDLPREQYLGQSEIESARNPIIPITERIAGLPIELTDCLGRGLAARPADRYRDGKVFEDALRSAAPAARAVRLYDELRRQDEALAMTVRNVFLRLTALAGGKSVQRIARDELRYTTAAENERVELVLRRFQAAGLLAIDTAPREAGGPREHVRVLHGELLRGWTQIRIWNEELDGETRDRLSSLALAAREWQASGRRRSLLWSDRPLAHAIEIQHAGRFAYNELESKFIRRSERRRRRTRIARSIGVVAPFILLFGVLWQRSLANDHQSQRDSARQTLARSLQETGRRHVVDGRPQRALPFLVAAGEIAQPGPALQMLFHEASRRLPVIPALEHDSAVMRAAFSPDGSHIVTATADGSAYVWDVATQKRTELRDQKRSGDPAEFATMAHAHTEAVVAAAFSPDGKRVVTGSQDRTATVWNAVTGERVAGPFAHDGFVRTAVFSPDGTQVLTASLDHTARIWSIETGVVVQRIEHGDAVWSAAFSPDGSRVVTACLDGKARLWTPATGALEHELKHRDRVWSAAFSPDGSRVVTASQDGTAQIWDASSGQPIQVKNHTATVATPLSFEHRDGVTSAAFDASGLRVVTTSENIARVWNAVTGAPISPWLEHRGIAPGAAFDRDGSRVVTAGADDARIWLTETGRLQRPYLEHTKPVASAMFSTDGTRVVTASSDGTARVWKVDRPDPEPSITRGGAPSPQRGLGGVVGYVAFSPDGKRKVTLNDATARIWDMTTGKLEHELPHETVVITAAFSPSGTQIVTASDRVARIWDVQRGEMLGAAVLPGRVRSATFSTDGKRVICTSGGEESRWEDTLRIWDIATGKVLPLALEGGGNFVSASLNRGGTRLVALNLDGAAGVWDAITGKKIASLEHRAGVTSVAFSPDGRRVVTASEDRTARVWDVATGATVAVLEHQERVASASFSPEGARVVTTSGDRTAQVWDATTGQPLTPPLPTGDTVVNAAFSADGAQLFTADRQAVQTWDVSLDTGSVKEWAQVAQRSPYVVENGVLAQRAEAGEPPGDLRDLPAHK